jgi:drug/metabolite transporter (DMT)-like permease
LNIEPVVGVLLGVLILHETLDPGVLLGGFLVLGAALLVSHPVPSVIEQAELP